MTKFPVFMKKIQSSDKMRLVWFYGISTIVGYLIPNPIFTYILNIWLVNIFCRLKKLNDQMVLFLTIQFSIKSTKLNGSKYCNVSLTIQLNISYLFTHS